MSVRSSLALRPIPTIAAITMNTPTATSAIIAIAMCHAPAGRAGPAECTHRRLPCERETDHLVRRSPLRPGVTWTGYHDDRFVAAVEEGPLWATQFHPEKSGDAGAALLRNWLDRLR